MSFFDQEPAAGGGRQGSASAGATGIDLIGLGDDGADPFESFASNRASSLDTSDLGGDTDISQGMSALQVDDGAVGQNEAKEEYDEEEPDPYADPKKLNTKESYDFRYSIRHIYFYKFCTDVTF